MDEIANMSSVPAVAQNDSPGSTGETVAAFAVVVVTCAAVAGTYYAVRRGIDRRIVKKIQEHLKPEKTEE